MQWAGGCCPKAWKSASRSVHPESSDEWICAHKSPGVRSMGVAARERRFTCCATCLAPEMSACMARNRSVFGTNWAAAESAEEIEVEATAAVSKETAAEEAFARCTFAVCTCAVHACALLPLSLGILICHSPFHCCRVDAVRRSEVTAERAVLLARFLTPNRHCLNDAVRR